MKGINNGSRVLFGLLSALLLVLAAGCAGKMVSYEVPAGQAVVEVEASSYGFSPNIIHARAGETLLLRVKNVAGMEHNLTVVGPDGTKLVDTDLPAGKVTELRLFLQRAGTYPVSCGKPFHATFGMTGKVVAEGE